MSGSREGSRLASSIFRRQLSLGATPSCARRFQSTQGSAKDNGLADLDQQSSFLTAEPDKAAIEAFNSQQRMSARERKLPGNRYQYHPPKYYRGPLHPVQMPASSDPIARDFVPGPFSMPRLKHTFDSTIAPDLMTLSYTHHPPGYEPPVSNKGQLREWDGSSPYHKNRPRRGPRGGGSSRLPLLERDITFNNIPEIKAVSISAFAPKAAENKEYLQVARSVVQSISSNFPETTVMKHHVVQWKVKKGDKVGAKITMTGAQAYEFVDKLVTLVLPKIKDWPGIKATSGDGSGNIAFGLEPEWMSYFPEIEYNFSMYPGKLIPGCHVFIQTTGTSDRQGRLLLEALGFPFHGKVKH